MQHVCLCMPKLKVHSKQIVNLMTCVSAYAFETISFHLRFQDRRILYFQNILVRVGAIYALAIWKIYLWWLPVFVFLSIVCVTMCHMWRCVGHSTSTYYLPSWKISILPLFIVGVILQNHRKKCFYTFFILTFHIAIALCGDLVSHFTLLLLRSCYATPLVEIFNISIWFFFSFIFSINLL